jgi:tRNA-(ms[2]io[6]A)-hydroxylase
LIEARSCERFAKLAPRLDAQLAEFYGSLLKSEARHFEDYLRLAEQYSTATEVDARLNYFRDVEGALIESPDTDFRFHSGTPSLVA